jgi:hypothetical protein
MSILESFVIGTHDNHFGSSRQQLFKGGDMVVFTFVFGSENKYRFRPEFYFHAVEAFRELSIVEKSVHSIDDVDAFRVGLETLAHFVDRDKGFTTLGHKDAKRELIHRHR